MDSEILYPGKFIVDNSGISVIVSVDENGIATAQTLLPKSAFVEAYNKYIAEPLINTTEVHLKPDIDEEDTDYCAREIFNGICPYTNIKCEKWTCSVCEVEQRERRFAEGDTD